MKNILVPVGSIETGINNLRYATSLAALTNARIYVTCIKTMATELILKEVLENVNTQDVQVVSKPISGDIFEGITQLSDTLKIDLIILSPQSIEIKDEIYLGNVTTKIIRETTIPLLVVPKDYLFRKFDSILFAFKNATIETKHASDTLKGFIDMFHATLHLLQVITPDTAENDRSLQPDLKALANSYRFSENATVFQGIVEHFNDINPELLCVLRRKQHNGFFRKLLRQGEVIFKKQFYTTKPLLVLKEQE
ncbi:MAG: universal stress protein [Patiriisocius sp.]|uniref:universal stress protein n=1 Tax=Patiriisocius sp. TaxID=2822396 RepID=UPI003EF49EFA